MIGKKSTRFMTLLLVCVISMSCRNRSSTAKYELITDSAIDHVGSYTSKTENLKLDIRVIDLLLDLTLSDTTGKVLYKTDVHADSIRPCNPNAPYVPWVSVVHSWFLVLDTTGTFWFYSGDIGMSVLKKDNRGNYVAAIDTNTYKRNLPGPAYRAMSDFEKAQYWH